MSLKAFHIVFVMASTILALFVGIWAIRDYRAGSDVTALVAGIGSFLAAVGLTWYGRWFLKKLKGVRYL